MINSKIYIAGHSGMVGSAIIRNLKMQKYDNFVYRSHSELDLTDQKKVEIFFKTEKPDQVYLAAAKTGGIQASISYPAEFIYKNLMIEANIIHSAFRNGVKKILFLGASCSYPKNAKQPISEKSLLSGYLDYTNEPYSIAKITGIKLCESYNRQYGKTHGVDYRSIIPSNLYGPGDNYNLENSHVIPALIRKFHEAKLKKEAKIILWGSGNPKREFLHVDDLADACTKIMNIDYNTYLNNTEVTCGHINIGSGFDISIKNLSKLIKKIVGYKGIVEFDLNKPDGVSRKLMDNRKINSLGWSPSISLEDGIAKTYYDYKRQLEY